jgi:hypothetical protein
MKDSMFSIHVHNITSIREHFKGDRRRSTGVWVNTGYDVIFIEANPDNAKFLRDAADEIDAVVAARNKETSDEQMDSDHRASRHR